MKITNAEPHNIEEIWDFIDDSFGFERGFFRDELPQQWDAECVQWENTFIIRDDIGRLASLLRIWELNLVQNRRRITVGGVGTVCTAEHARGQGGMSLLLKHAEQEMRHRGYPMAILSGDRFRYEVFGYRSAGHNFNLKVDARGLERRNIEAVTPLTISVEVLNRMEEVRTQMPYHVRRRTCESKQTYEAKKCQVLAGGEHDFGYLVLDSGRLHEWGGNTQTALCLAKFAIQQEWTDGLTFTLPADLPTPTELLDVYSYWSITPMCSAAIYDLDKTLEAFDAQDLQSTMSELSPTEQVWQLFGKPNAPLNIWLPATDMV